MRAPVQGTLRAENADLALSQNDLTGCTALIVTHTPDTTGFAVKDTTGILAFTVTADAIHAAP